MHIMVYLADKSGRLGFGQVLGTQHCPWAEAPFGVAHLCQHICMWGTGSWVLTWGHGSGESLTLPLALQ